MCILRFSRLQRDETIQIKSKVFNCSVLILTLLFNVLIFAGPPFRTDDPVPVPFMHGELYLIFE
jgi:hypothetical protein